MTAAIEIDGLTKVFGSFRALDEFAMTVEHGEIAAFLGPNGAGKSTTIRVLLGLLRASSGTVRLLDGDPWHDAVALHHRLVYVPGDVNLWPGLTGGEAIDVLHRLRGGTEAARRDALIERFELDPSKKARTYSKGNRQKVALVAALSSDVELYIFDEPTSGLDPLMAVQFDECVRELREQGRTVLLSSHILAEVEKLCDTVTIIRSGRTVQSGRLDELRLHARSKVVARTMLDASGIARLDGVNDFTVTGDEITFSLDGDHTAEVMRALAALDLVTMTSNPPSLEDLFLSQYVSDAARADTADAGVSGTGRTTGDGRR
jgi:ABC-2 type transport system ATP-binding protein